MMNLWNISTRKWDILVSLAIFTQYHCVTMDDDWLISHQYFSVTNDRALSIFWNNVLMKKSLNISYLFVFVPHRKRVSLPYVKDSRYSIIQGSHSVILTLALGVKVIWDGDSYLEVTVQPRYKHMMCGLCGEYSNKWIKYHQVISTGFTYFVFNRFAVTVS